MAKEKNEAKALKLGENDIICPSCNSVLTISEDIKNNELIQCPKCEVAIKNPFFIGSSNIKKYSDIDKAINNLKDKTGFLVISINDYYVQFTNGSKNQELYCEAVSHNFLPKVGDLTNQFQTLSFTIKQNSNYYKSIDLETVSTKDIIIEIEKIFVELYRIPFVNYQIESEIDDVVNDNIAGSQNNLSQQQKITSSSDIVDEPINLTKKQKNWIVGIVVFVIILIIGFATDKSSSSSSNSLYTVNTTTYVATSKSSFDEMFRYINDGDNQALSTLMSYGQVQTLSSGTKVNLISSHFSYCVVSVKGSTRKIWIVPEHITKD